MYGLSIDVSGGDNCMMLLPHSSSHQLLACCASGVEFAQLSDGRHLCLTCIGSVIVDNTDIQPLYQEVLQYYTR
jgi:hypothetical protein